MIQVLKLKDLIKYIFLIIIAIAIIFIFYFLFSFLNRDNSNLMHYFFNDSIGEINSMYNSTSNSQNNIINIIFENSILSDINIVKSIKDNDGNLIDYKKLASYNNYAGNSSTNYDLMQNSSITQDTTNSNNINNSNLLSNSNSEIEQAQTDVKTEIIPNSVNPRSTNDYYGVKINNGTDYTLTEDMLTPNIEVNKKKIGIYHTHTCESYTSSDAYNYEPTGTFRTTDLNFSVAKVGDELENQLKSYGVQVDHNKTYHDYPAYNGSYSRSLETAKAILSSNPDTDIIIDLHRDAIGDESYAPKVKIGDEYVSQLMFVIGSNVANPVNSNWNQNLKFAIKLQQKANDMYPGLFKPIILRNSEYNQHISKAACIIEVGATGNTLDESINAMKYLAKILQEF